MPEMIRVDILLLLLSKTHLVDTHVLWAPYDLFMFRATVMSHGRYEISNHRQLNWLTSIEYDRSTLLVLWGKSTGPPTKIQ